MVSLWHDLTITLDPRFEPHCTFLIQYQIINSEKSLLRHFTTLFWNISLKFLDVLPSPGPGLGQGLGRHGQNTSWEFIYFFFQLRRFVQCENWFRDFYRTYTIFIFIADNLICRSEYFWITCGGTHSRDVSWRRVGLTDWAAPVNFVEQFIVACTVFIIS